MKRREFISVIKKYGLLGLGITQIPLLFGCIKDENSTTFKLSILQNSLDSLFRNNLNIFSFAKKAKEWGFEGIDYSSKYYVDEINKNDIFFSLQQLAKRLKEESERYKQKSLIISVEGEGMLASKDENIRKNAIDNHKKWIDAASVLECHSISVEVKGEDDVFTWQEYSRKGLTSLCEYAKNQNINILVKNHGHFTSDGAILSGVIYDVGLENCGTIPNFSDYCIKVENDECVMENDRYKGFKSLISYAKGINATSFNFDKMGQETTIDYDRMLSIANDAYYKGFISVDYRGKTLETEQGVLLTKSLLQASILSLSKG